MPAEGFKVRESADPLAVDIAIDIGSDGKRYQLEQPVFGPDAGAKTMTDDADGKRFPVGGAQLGATNESAAGTDTATSGLNGLLKRLAQNITSLITALNAGIKRADSFATATVISTATVSGAVDIRGYRFTGIITDANFDGTSVRFQVSTDNGAYSPLLDTAGVRVAITGMGPSQAFAAPATAQDWSYIKVDCASTQNTTNSVFTLQLKS